MSSFCAIFIANFTLFFCDGIGCLGLCTLVCSCSKHRVVPQVILKPYTFYNDYSNNMIESVIRDISPIILSIADFSGMLMENV